MPQRNDVSMRTLRFREVPPASEKDPFAALEAFHANRLEWVYLEFTPEEREKVNRVKQLGVIFGGSGSSGLNSWIGGEGEEIPLREIAMLDLDGNPVIPPHKRGWANPPMSGDPSNPKYLDGHIRFYKKYLDYGVDTLHRDEVRGFVTDVTRYGGGFTETGLAGFRNWLQANLSGNALAALGIHDIGTFSYADYLRERKAPVGDAFARYEGPLSPFWKQYWQETSVNFFRTLIREVKAAAGRPITFSCNNSSLQVWDPETRYFDFAISELLLGSANPRHIWDRSEAARAVGKFQIFGSPKTRGTEVDPGDKIRLTRRVIATAYAAGMASPVPWDIFEQTEDGTGRYFGDPADYADLYAFVAAQDWNGYDRIRAAGPDIADDRIPVGAIRIHGPNPVYAFVQENDAPNAPLLIHLVDWGKPLVPMPRKGELAFVETAEGERVYFSKDGWENLKRTVPAPFSLSLDAGLLGLDRVREVILLKPALYANQQQGADAVEEIPLAVNIQEDLVQIDLPALTPWGILKIKR